MKEKFEVFKNNNNIVNSRILYALGIVDFQDENECKIYWDSFSKFMKIFVNRESSSFHEIVNFVCNVNK